MTIIASMLNRLIFLICVFEILMSEPTPFAFALFNLLICDFVSISSSLPVN